MGYLNVPESIISRILEGDGMEDEFELVPLSPIRKLEKKLKEIEGMSAGKVLNDLVDVVKTNQKIVDDLVRINSSTIKEMTEVNTSLKLLIERMDTFLDRVESATTEPSAELMDKIQELVSQNKKIADAYDEMKTKLDKMERRVNALIVTKMAKRRM